VPHLPLQRYVALLKGTKIQRAAWNLASLDMKQQIDQLRGLSDSRLLCLEINWRQILSLADVIIF
jgi:hypothetical protein